MLQVVSKTAEAGCKQVRNSLEKDNILAHRSILLTHCSSWINGSVDAGLRVGVIHVDAKFVTKSMVTECDGKKRDANNNSTGERDGINCSIKLNNICR